MKPFSNHRTRRNTIFVVMLVWVFALASGMANACLLETPGKHAHIGASHSSSANHPHASDALAGSAVVALDHDNDTSTTKESCLKACDDGLNAQIKLQTSVDPTDPGLAPFVVFAWNAVTPIASAPSRLDDPQIRVVGPPFRLRYSRLTL